MIQHTFSFIFAILVVGAVTTVLYFSSWPFYFVLGLLKLWPGKTVRSHQIGSILHKFSADFVLFMAGVRVFVGKESQKRLAAFEGRNVVYVFNHTTNCDPFLLSASLPANVRFVYKKELGYVPLLGCGLVLAGHVAVDRGARDKAINALHRAEAQLLMKPSEGGSFALSPEGTRSKTGQLITPFKKGPFHVAKNTGATVVPLILQGGHDIFPPGSSKLRPGIVSVKCLEPVDPIKFKDADALKDEVERRMLAASAPESWAADELCPDKALPVSANPIFGFTVMAAVIAGVYYGFLCAKQSLFPGV